MYSWLSEWIIFALHNLMNKPNYEQVKWQISTKILKKLWEFFWVCYMNDPLIQTQIIYYNITSIVINESSITIHAISFEATLDAIHITVYTDSKT